MSRRRCPCCTCIHAGERAAGCAIAHNGNAVQRWIEGWEPRGDVERHGPLFVCPPTVGVEPCPGWRDVADDGQGTLWEPRP